MREAVESAIAASEQEVRYLRSRVRKAKTSLRSAAKQTKAAFRSLDHASSEHLEDASGAITALLDDASTSIEGYFDRYTEVLPTFNIALFGRTGSGKSSLISALAELDGELVSQGESDWTVDVTPVSWNSCRLYDTPGINGWGRTRSVEDLEVAARRAVEVADVVLLCFDSQSQQASEFAKVSAWVQEFSKPAIAVLNVRNAMWRHPARIPAEAARMNLQKSVREHASNIRDSLTSIGMTNVPVVAVHTKHAIDARAAQPYRGPDDVNHNKRRDEFGLDYLYTWSNLGTLQDLISAVVSSGGKELRISGLRGGVAAVFNAWHDALDGEASGIQGNLDILDASIAEEFNILGYPDESGAENWLTPPDPEGNLLFEVEEARGGPYKSKKKGRFERHVAQVVRNELGPLRASSLKEASNCVRATFDKKLKLSGKQFTARVFLGAAIKSAAEKAAGRCSKFLERELKMTANEAASDVEFEQMHFKVDGTTGALDNRLGSAARLGGVAAGAVGAGLAIAIAANLWNPIGWVGAAALGVTAIVSTVLNWFGKKRQSSAERKRLRARKDALGNARLGVNKAYAQMEDALTKSFLEEARETRGPVARAMLANWLAVNRARLAVLSASDDVAKMAREMASPTSLKTVMQQALEAIKAGREGATSANGILLGEDWIKSSAMHVDSAVEAHIELSEMGDRDAKELLAALSAMDERVPSEQLSLWLSSIQPLAEASLQVEHLLKDARRRQSAPPRIVFLGDYNTGKTSLIKRTLAEAGAATPRSLRVAGKPTTSKETTYPLRHLELVDSPGLQSLNEGHEETAKGSTSGASVTIVVLNVNLVIGDHSTLKGFLNGTEVTRPKKGQTIFVIGRSDELGVDPLGNPNQFVRLRAQKEAELRAILSRWGVHDASVHTVSADPYGLVGDTPVSGPESYQDSFRKWDGIEALLTALEHVDQEHNGLVRLGVLDFTVDGLMRIKSGLLEELGELSNNQSVEAQIHSALQRGVDSGLVLKGSLTADAKAMARSHAERAASEAMSATEDQLAEATAAAAEWWADREFRADAVAFYEEAAKKINSWSEDTDSEISRNLRWSRHRNSRQGGRGLRQAEGIKAGVGYGRATTEAAKVLTNIFKERDALYGAAKKFTDIKFKPWGATKAAAKVAKVGAILAVVGVVLDVASFVSDQAAADKREKARNQLADSIESTLGQVEQLLLSGTEKSPGPATVLDTTLEGLRQQEAASVERARELEALILDRQSLADCIDEILCKQPLATGKDGSNA